MLVRDADEIKQVITQMTEKNYHRWRNDNPGLNKYISHPAVGYAKMAWRIGLEVEIDSPLVPKVLLPVEPLASYDHDYEFLK